MQVRKSYLWMLPLTVALSLTVAGCANWDELGQEKKIPLTGDRKALFPQGVPGVEFGAPPQQPSNSNIAINPAAMQANPDGAEGQGEGEQKSAQKQKQKQQKQQAAPADKSARTASRSKKSADEDPWVETR